MEQSGGDDSTHKVMSGIGAIDDAKTAVEVAMNGGSTDAEILKGVREVIKGEASVAETASFGMNAMTSTPLGIVGAVLEGKEAYEAFERGDMPGAYAGTVGAAGDIVSAASPFASAAGIAGSGVAAPAAFALGVGTKIGGAANEAIRSRGLYHDDCGNAESGSEHISEDMYKADQAAGGGIGGFFAATKTLAFEAPGMTVEGLGALGMNIGDAVARRDRAGRYANEVHYMDGISSLGHYDPTTGTVTRAARNTPAAESFAEDLADRDDEEASASELGVKRVERAREREAMRTKPAWMRRIEQIRGGRA